MGKRVAAIHDLSGLGRCSLTAAIPVLSAMGVQACPVPTAVLSNQTGFASYHIIDGTDWMEPFIREWQRCGVTMDGIYTGFLANAAQVDGIERFLAAFRTPNTLLLVDPVLGDDGRMYSTATDELCRKMVHLTAQADVITPNLTEACYLAGEDYDALVAHCHEAAYPELVAALARRLTLGGKRQVIITGVHYEGYVYNIAAGRESFAVRGHLIRGHFSGTGDLFASVVCGACIQGRSLREGVEMAAHLIEASLRDTDCAPEYGVEFEQHLRLLMED